MSKRSPTETALGLEHLHDPRLRLALVGQLGLLAFEVLAEVAQGRDIDQVRRVRAVEQLLASDSGDEVAGRHHETEVRVRTVPVGVDGARRDDDVQLVDASAKRGRSLLQIADPGGDPLVAALRFAQLSSDRVRFRLCGGDVGARLLELARGIRGRGLGHQGSHHDGHGRDGEIPPSPAQADSSEKAKSPHTAGAAPTHCSIRGRRHYTLSYAARCPGLQEDATRMVEDIRFVLFVAAPVSLIVVPLWRAHRRARRLQEPMGPSSRGADSQPHTDET